jgi:hypothetical protein
MIEGIKSAAGATFNGASTAVTFAKDAYVWAIDFVSLHPHWVFWGVVAYLIVRR